MGKPRKMSPPSRNGGQAIEKFDDKIPKTSLYSDTVITQDDGTFTRDEIYNLMKDELEDASEEGISAIVLNDAPERNNELEYKLIDATRSRLHKIASRPRLMPYTNLIRWPINFVIIPKCHIITPKGTSIGSFMPNDIHSIYKLPTPSLNSNERFLVESCKYNA